MKDLTKDHEEVARELYESVACTVWEQYVKWECLDPKIQWYFRRLVSRIRADLEYGTDRIENNPLK